MNQKRKAELQRKLSMAPVPRPPDGLADRIKGDIPDILNTQRDRERLSRSVAFNIRVAASILLLVSSAFLTIHLLTRVQTRESAVAVADRAASPARTSAKPELRAMDTAEVTVTMAEESYDAATGAKQTAPLVTEFRDQEVLSRRNERNDEAKKKDESGVGGRAFSGLEGGIVGSVAASVPQSAALPAAPPPAAPVREPAPTDAKEVVATSPVVADNRVANRARAAEQPVAVADAISLTKAAQADDFAFASPKTLFGISVDPGAFSRVKKVIESGEKPASSIVDVHALVNYFAGALPSQTRDVRIDVEASRGPLGQDQGSALLRYTIDAEATDRSRRPALPPVATNVILQIEINPRWVADYRMIGGGKNMSVTEPVLLRNASVTGLVELKLKPDVPRRQIIATIRFRYRSVVDGIDQVVIKNVRARDLEQTWLHSSHRHRLATLGAVWGESLQGAKTAMEVAETAEQLATEAPEDSRARELAAAATASSRLQTSAPTGSGR